METGCLGIKQTAKPAKVVLAPARFVRLACGAISPISASSSSYPHQRRYISGI